MKCLLSTDHRNMNNHVSGTDASLKVSVSLFYGCPGHIYFQFILWFLLLLSLFFSSPNLCGRRL